MARSHRTATFTLAPFLVAGGFAFPNAVRGADIEAASCERDDVEAAITSSADGDTVRIPAGSCTWTSNLTIDGRALTLVGAGSDPGGEALTEITDGVPKDPFPNVPQALLWRTPDAGLVRLSGIRFQGGSPDEPPDNNGIVMMQGATHSLRIDHCAFIPTNTSALILRGDQWGVVDHNEFDISAHSGYAVYTMGGGYGDASWAAANSLGTEEAMYFEDNRFFNDQVHGIHYYATDGWIGSRVVTRHNEFVACTWGNHGTESGGRWRGMRQFEVYSNHFEWDLQGQAFSSMIGSRGGVGVIFDNTATLPSGGINQFIDFGLRRSFEPFSPWGQCDGGSPWDQNSDANGYRCLDQTGAGRSDLITGDDPTPVAWPNQESDPNYVWNNTVNGDVDDAVTNAPAHVQEGRDFFNGIPRPGYTPYVYPHPLVDEGGDGETGGDTTGGDTTGGAADTAGGGDVGTGGSGGATDGGGATSVDSGGTAGSGGEAPAPGGADDAGGCGCRSDRDAAGLDWAGVVLLTACRRRRPSRLRSR